MENETWVLGYMDGKNNLEIHPFRFVQEFWDRTVLSGALTYLGFKNWESGYRQARTDLGCEY